MNYKNHLKLGHLRVIHKGKEVASSLNSLQFRDNLNTISSASYKVGRIPPGFEHRADKIADLFYESPDLDWLICWTNNISDPFQQLNVGDRIRILDI
jgi:hypothetical protein